jgi:hypothetical protein
VTPELGAVSDRRLDVRILLAHCTVDPRVDRRRRDHWFGVDQATNAIVGRMGCGGGAVVAVTGVSSLSDVV